MQMKAPVVIFAYNRADHLKTTFEALCKCNGAENTDIYFFCDAAKNVSSVKTVNEVREYVDSIVNSTAFKSITLFKSEKNKGLAKSIIGGVSEIIKKTGRIIVLEDDCVVSPYFLEYMNSALDYYENNKNIGSISGFSPALDFPKDYKEDIYFSYRSCSWSWATWIDRWNGIDWELKNVGDFFTDREFVRKFNLDGTDRFLRLYKQTKGNGSSWSVRFGAHLVKNDMMTVYPIKSYTMNIGCDETGIHSHAEDAKKVAVNLDEAKENVSFCEPFEDKRIHKLYRNLISGGLASDIKRFIGRKIVILKYKFRG